MTRTDPTDQSADSIGCGMAFVSWLQSNGSTMSQVAPAMVGLGDSGTLAQLYAQLTSDAASNAWPNFQSAVQGLPNGVTSDDPFGALVASPATTGAQAPAQISAALRRASSLKPAVAKAALCPPKSKRLLPPQKKK